LRALLKTRVSTLLLSKRRTPTLLRSTLLIPAWPLLKISITAALLAKLRPLLKLRSTLRRTLLLLRLPWPSTLLRRLLTCRARGWLLGQLNSSHQRSQTRSSRRFRRGRRRRSCGLGRSFSRRRDRR
jgi:hypothetical protein